MNANPEKPVTTIVETLDEMSDAPRVCLGDLLDEFGGSAHAPALFIPAAILVSPLSGVPFLSSLLGLTIMLIAMQAAVGRQRIWLPGMIRNRALDHDQAQRVSKTMRRVAAHLEGMTKRRLRALLRPAPRAVIYLVCAASGAVLPLLELVPLSSSLVGASVAVIAIGMMARDGLFVLSGLVFLVMAFSVPVTIFAHFA